MQLRQSLERRREGPPAERRAWTAGRLPFMTAWWRGVLPSLSLAYASAPSSMSLGIKWAVSSWVALWRADAPVKGNIGLCVRENGERREEREIVSRGVDVE